jgi:hypothetical protein
VVDRATGDGPVPVPVGSGGLANGTAEPPYEFVRQTGALGVHRVFVRDLGQCWCQQGLPGTTDGVDAAVAALRHVLDGLGASRRVVAHSGGHLFIRKLRDAGALLGILESALRPGPGGRADRTERAAWRPGIVVVPTACCKSGWGERPLRHPRRVPG